MINKLKEFERKVDFMREVLCSTPSRICLFGEHLDYLGLEVIASAIDLRFSARVKPRNDGYVYLKIRDSKLGQLNVGSTQGRYQQRNFSLHEPIVYDKRRDYIKSVFKVLMREGYDLMSGFDIVMDSTIPIGKGMCSSSTMVIVLIKGLLEAIESKDAENPEKIAYLGYLSEVAEFNEPGGMMDHYSSAIGSLVHIDFENGKATPTKLEAKIPGCFVLFDTMQAKDTTKVLADSKIPVLEAIEQLGCHGITSVRDFINDEENYKYIDELDDFHKLKLNTAIDNYKILMRAKAMLESGDTVDEYELGALLKEHHKNLRDGLNISTDVMEKIFDIAYANGALGGKLNGSGGGGCLYVYAKTEDAERILKAVEAEGYPGKILNTDTGARVDEVY